MSAVALLFGLPPCAWLIFKRSPIDGLVGLQLGSIIGATILLLLSEAVQQSSFVDLALAELVLSFGGGLVYARFLERWV